MRSLVLLVVAQVLVVLDLRVDGVDLVPDPLGWALSAVALLRLERHVAFRLAAAAAGLAALVSVPSMVDPTGPPVLEPVLYGVQTAVVFGTCTGVMALRPTRRRTAQVLRWADLGLGAASLLIVPALAFAFPTSADLPGPALGVLLVLGVATVLVFVWFLVWCLGVARADRAGRS